MARMAEGRRYRRHRFRAVGGGRTISRHPDHTLAGVATVKHLIWLRGLDMIPRL